VFDGGENMMHSDKSRAGKNPINDTHGGFIFLLGNGK
jgi:hypothetical protein